MHDYDEYHFSLFTFMNIYSEYIDRVQMRKYKCETKNERKLGKNKRTKKRERNKNNPRNLPRVFLFRKAEQTEKNNNS